jgi:Ca-activated chloride channel family protein
MSFLWPAALLLLLLIPAGVWLDQRIERSRRARLAPYGAFGRPAPDATVTGAATAAAAPAGVATPERRRGRGWRLRIPAALFLVGITVMVVALARPQAVVSLPRLEGTVVLAFDVSGSMAATDFQPTRMEAAKAAAKSFVENQPEGVAIGVVAFSDSGLSVQVPTTDTSEVLASIDRLTPERGTSLGQGILASLNAIAVAENGEATQGGYYTNRSPAPSVAPVPPGSHGSAMIVMLSDGENNENPDPLSAAQTAADTGIRIETVGIGSPSGTTLDINGFRVHTQLNEDLLKSIAEATGGTYHPAQTQPDLQAVYDSLGRTLVVKPEPIEVTALFAAAAVLLLAAGILLSLRWLGRAL